MNRRGFLASLAAAVAGVAAYEADPERLLWVPGAKSFFLPPAKPVELAPLLVEPDDEYLRVLQDDDYGIDVDMNENSYRHALRHGSTFQGIGRVRVFEGGVHDGRLLHEHAGRITPAGLTTLRDRMHAIDAAKTIDVDWRRKTLPERA